VSLSHDPAGPDETDPHPVVRHASSPVRPRATSAERSAIRP
jgi:hypothetical protein